MADFRTDCPNPPLPFYLAAAAQKSNAIQFDSNDTFWQRIPSEPLAAWDLAKNILFRTPGRDGAAIVNRARLAMLIFGTGVGIILAAWSWQIAGWTGAIIATTLFAFDPNFLGHSPLIKNDVAMAFGTVFTFWILWRLGRHLSLQNAIALIFAFSLAINMKFSGLALAPLLAISLCIRAAMPKPWPVMSRQARSLFQKLGVAAMILIACFMVSVVVTWATYRFRFSTAPDPSVHIDTHGIIDELTFRQYDSTHPTVADIPIDLTQSREQVIAGLASRIDALSPAFEKAKSDLPQLPFSLVMRTRLLNYIEAGALNQATARSQLDLARQLGPGPANNPQFYAIANDIRLALQQAAHALNPVQYCISHPNGQPSLAVDAALFGLKYHLMPEAWINGVLSVVANGTTRINYLLGKIEFGGRWDYFPLATLFKMPLASLISISMAIVFALKQWKQVMSSFWLATCIMLPAFALLLAAMSSNVNIGLRHILAVFPLLYVGTAVIMAPLVNRSWQIRRLMIILCAVLALEALTAWPDYISFFNLAAKSWRDPWQLLGDSNLDWGQDLPALAKWQKEHGNPPIGLAYFGTVDPNFYQIQYDPLPAWPPTREFATSHVLAISATGLQGIYNNSFIGYSALSPSEVLGGTIYLYDLRTIR
ncbi:MAG TPA: hypothetical protein VHD56_07795 [Tepidisphaeraceae bacterium]|nr:hypothetical protein [Tepidisphaeraceae bacterium]